MEYKSVLAVGILCTLVHSDPLASFISILPQHLHTDRSLSFPSGVMSFPQNKISNESLVLPYDNDVAFVKQA